MLKEVSKKTKLEINKKYSLLSKKERNIVLYGT